MKKAALLTACSLFVAVWLTSLYNMGLAHAAPPSPDVLGDPLGFADYATALWHSGAILNTIIVVALGVLKVLQAKVAWFQQGNRIVWVSAAIGGLSLIANGISNGSTPNISMVVIALTTTIAAGIQPKHDPEKAAA